MLSYGVRNVLSRCTINTTPRRATPAARLSGRHCSASSGGDVDRVSALLQLCVDRHYVSPGHTNTERLKCGTSCIYGPLGTELRRNLLEQWWRSVTRSTAQVFGISTLSSSEDPAAETRGQLRMVESDCLLRVLEQPELSREQLVQEVQALIRRSPSPRTNFLQGREGSLTQRGYMCGIYLYIFR